MESKTLIKCWKGALSHPLAQKWLWRFRLGCNGAYLFWAGMIFVLNAKLRWVGVPHWQVMVINFLSNGYQIMLMKPILVVCSERKTSFLTCAILPSNGRKRRKTQAWKDWICKGMKTDFRSERKTSFLRCAILPSNCECLFCQWCGVPTLILNTCMPIPSDFRRRSFGTIWNFALAWNWIAAACDCVVQQEVKEINKHCGLTCLMFTQPCVS